MPAMILNRSPRYKLKRTGGKPTAPPHMVETWLVDELSTYGAKQSLCASTRILGAAAVPQPPTPTPTPSRQANFRASNLLKIVALGRCRPEEACAEGCDCTGANFNVASRVEIRGSLISRCKNSGSP